MKKRVFLIIFLIGLCIFYGSSPGLSQGREYERIRAFTAPATDEPLGGEIGGEYLMAAGDKIEVFVWQNPDLTMVVTIRPDGKISYPLIGTLKAAGLTVDQLQGKMRERLKEYIRVPEVTVSVAEFAGNKIIVLGEVGYPGIYTYKGAMNLLEAIALAGDFGVDGKRDSIIVVSDNLTPHPKVRRVNLLRAIRKGASGNDIILKPNDVVYVPKRFMADLNQFVADIEPFLDQALDVFTWRDSIRDWYHHGESN